MANSTSSVVKCSWFLEFFSVPVISRIESTGVCGQ